MIKNERQYQLTRAQLDRFQESLDALRRRRKDLEDLRGRFEIAAIESQLAALREELDEYDSLKKGFSEVGPVRSLEELPKALIRARISRGLTQRDLAERLGLKEQQVQRYEANDWTSASLHRLIQVADVLELSLLDDVRKTRLDKGEIARQLRRAGLDPKFIQSRLSSSWEEDEGIAAILDLAGRVHRIYGWEASDVLSGDELDIRLPDAVAFKWPRRASDARIHAYTVYTHYLALLALQATTHLEASPIPSVPEELRDQVLRRSKILTFETVLNYVWDLGIPVIPLADPGAFHAVLWRTGGRNAIVLKQQNRTRSRWAFDLLHEVGHAREEPAKDEYGVVDDDPEADQDSEVAANRFAGDVLLDGRAEELAQECVEEARGKVEFLKAAVPRVAARNKVETADLANYLAYRLSLQNVNWWGAATNLQSGEKDAWEVARDMLFRRADLRRLNELDRRLLSQALGGRQNG